MNTNRKDKENAGPASYDKLCEDFLPASMREMKNKGWERPDFVYVTGDAYVDHSSFGPAVISRVLTGRGYKVCMLPQPDWKDASSIEVFGEPRLGFLVSSGNMDSMVNHYTVARKKRHEDAYSPGGRAGMRPDRAVIVYCNLIRQRFKHTPIIIGGIEASLRRFSHYDYWDDSVRRSILVDSGADLLSYGMGERSITEIADALDSGLQVSELTFIRGTVYRKKERPDQEDMILLPDFEESSVSKKKYAESFRIQFENTDPFTARVLCENYGSRGYVIQNPPAYPLSMQEMDDVYDLPYANRWHPMYDDAGGIPALEEIRFSITSNRGCFGSCSFCALTYHQGRIVQARSHESILREAEMMTKDPEFKGYIHDIGGPTADFRQPSCSKQLEKGTCRNRQCLYPKPCPNLNADHSDYVNLLRSVRKLPGVKKVFVRSGVRFDYVLADRNNTFLKELVKYHVSGQLRVAPEHVSDRVLSLMGKPEHKVYEEFVHRFGKACREAGMQQYAVPYFMSSHPGCTIRDAVELAEYIRDLGYMPEQVQDFYPTPSTVSTCMYYTGIHPLTGEKVYVPKDPHEKAIQRALMQYRNPANRSLVLEGLKKAGRMDLVGYGPKCLIRPERKETDKRTGHSQNDRARQKNMQKKNAKQKNVRKKGRR